MPLADGVEPADARDLSVSDAAEEVHEDFLGAACGARPQELLLLVGLRADLVPGEQVEDLGVASEAPVVPEDALEKPDRDRVKEGEDVEVLLGTRSLLVDDELELTLDLAPVESLITRLEKPSILQVEDSSDLLVAVAHDERSAQLIKLLVFEPAIRG